MDKVGVLLISKCLSASAIADVLLRSRVHHVELFVIEKQPNPFNLRSAKEHVVVPDLDPSAVVSAAARFKDRVRFALTDTEDFIIAGGRDMLETETRIPMISVDKAHAIERSKAEQRSLFESVFAGANPNYRVFDPLELHDREKALSEFRRTIEEFGPSVVKPDAPARGAGVGVWGADFSTTVAGESFFLSLLERGRVVVEKKIEGEESSFHAFSDGKHFVPAPLTRDYKRGLDEDRGNLTGGMGSYRGAEFHLPYVREEDWDSLASAEEHAFRKWRGRGSDPGLRGIVLYDAIMHTGDGFKVLERNSRGGNTEFISIVTTMKDDLVDVCFKILDSDLKGIKFTREASVVTCAVPTAYGGGPGMPTPGAVVDTSGAKLGGTLGGQLRVCPMDLRLEGGVERMGTSRTLAIVGISEDLQPAREISVSACSKVKGPLRWRSDIASAEDVARRRSHLDSLRSSA